MRYIFARHGETDYNKSHSFQGRIDSSLNRRGILQSDGLAQYCAAIGLKKILSSPMKRALQTASAVATLCDLPIERDERLREICYGAWEGVQKSTIDAHVLKQREQTLFTFVHPGAYQSMPGESYEILYHRLLPFFKSLAIESAHPQLIVSHGGVMMCANIFFSKNKEDIPIQRFKNNEILIVDIGIGVRKITL